MNKVIYLADDEKNIRDLMCLFLRNDGFTVEEFSNGDDLYKAFVEKPADMIVLDIMMPGTDGLTICSKIRERHNVPIIIVSARDSELDRVTGITMGSDDYLAKPFSPVELVARVKAIFRRIDFERSNENMPVNLSYGDIEIDAHDKRAKINDEYIDFTPTELSVMAYLIANKDKAVSREELLKNVWKMDFEVDTRATDDVVKRLRKKLSAHNSIIKIAAVWGFGFRLEIEGESEN